jgi:RNA polymerase II subunit A-like phosphatase
LDLCADCGADLQQIDMGKSSKANVPMIHSVPELKVSEEIAKKLGRADTDRLLGDKKLALLVDLDQTLIHTTNDHVPNNLKDVYHFQLYGPSSPWYHTRLRPGTLAFLKTIEQYYELHICTFGARNYAHMICAFLDENGRLFSHRILSRDECLNATSKKDNLKALFPDDCADSMVCIIDDREDVWNHATNLIQVKPYHFFQHTGDINAPENLAKRELDGEGVDFNKIVKLKKANKTYPNSSSKSSSSSINNSSQEKKSTDNNKDNDCKNSDTTNVESKERDDEEQQQQQDVEMKNIKEDTNDVEIKNEKKEKDAKDGGDDSLVEIQDPDDYLLYLEAILIKIHNRFYELYERTSEIPDLKTLIPKLKSEVLVGVVIVFSGLVPNNVKLEYSRPYLIAKNLGARVLNAITEETTHLVAASTGTQKVLQAQKNSKIAIVTPEWLWTCAERWEHVEEKLFPLTANRSHKMRQVPAHCSPERIPDGNEVKFNNPYLQMSDDDIASMEAEVGDDSTDTDSDDEREDDTPEVERNKRKRKRSSCTEAQIHKIDISGVKKNEHNGESDSSESGKSTDSETLGTKFRRGKMLLFITQCSIIKYNAVILKFQVKKCRTLILMKAAQATAKTELNGTRWELNLRRDFWMRRKKMMFEH